MQIKQFKQTIQGVLRGHTYIFVVNGKTRSASGIHGISIDIMSNGYFLLFIHKKLNIFQEFDHQKQLQPEFPCGQHAYNKICLKLIANLGSSSLLKILTSEILQSALNDPKPNSRNQASKVPYTCALQYPESQIFVRFTLR